MILIPKAMTLVPRSAYNGARGDSRDPLYIDAAQAYLTAGKPWTEPVVMGPIIYAPTSGGEHVLVTRWVPITVRPGCCGLAWRGRLCRLDRSGIDHPNTAVAADVFAVGALGTALNPFQSVIPTDTVKSLPIYDADTEAERDTAARLVQSCSVVGPDPAWYPVPPEVPTPGILQFDPVLSYRTLLIRFRFVGIGIGHLVVQPLVTAQAIGGLSP